jgi:hypothetical protein
MQALRVRLEVQVAVETLGIQAVLDQLTRVAEVAVVVDLLVEVEMADLVL